jgi:hypothetical protein
LFERILMTEFQSGHSERSIIGPMSERDEHGFHPNEDPADLAGREKVPPTISIGCEDLQDLCTKNNEFLT